MAIAAESLDTQKMWKPTTLPSNKKAINSILVFRIKKMPS